jgi:mycothiol synthase
VRAVSTLAEAATEADGVRPLSEHVMLHLRYGGDQRVRNVLV